MKQSRLAIAGASAGALASILAGPLAGAGGAHRVARAGAVAVHAGTFAGASKARRKGHAHGVRVSVRVEGMRSTLLASTFVNATPRPIDPDGKPADTCEGDTAAVALGDATHSHWTAGPYYSGLGYSVVGILGESHPFTSPYYWSVWLDGKAATTGICTATLHPGESILFFPQCSAESAAGCPQGLFDPPVLSLSGPTRARVGKAIAVKVLSLENLTGKPSAAAGVQLSAGGHTVRTGASGTAHLRFSRTGSFRVVASAPGAIRDELTVGVRR
jgi:hypothetical protein